MNRRLLYIIILGLVIIFDNHVFGQNFRLVSPSENAIFEVGKREGISWISTDSSRISFEYSINGTNWNKIFYNIRADLEHVGWKIPNDLSGKKIKLRVLNFNTSVKLFETNYLIEIRDSEISNILNKTTSQENILKILPLGNSITFDNRANDIRLDSAKSGYRFPLYQLLTASGITFDFIGSEHSGGDNLPSGYDDNAGFPGIYDHQLHSLLSTGILTMPQYGVLDTLTNGPYLETYVPDIILLHIGTNGNNLSLGTSSDEIEDILDEIDRVESLLSKNIKVFVARIIDRVPNVNYVTQLNDNVEIMIIDRISNPLNDAYPDDILLVDMEDGAGLRYEKSPDPNGSPGDMNDDLHPNDKGYSKIASKWFTSINSFVKNCTDNSISYWHFDEINSASYSDKLAINIASCTDCPNSVEGMNNNGLTFDGTNELIIINDNTINTNLAGSFTVEGWIKTNQIGITNKVFVGKYNGGGESSWWLGMNASDSLARFSVRSSNTSDILTLVSDKKIIDGKWHHLVGIKDHGASRLTLYIDGILEDEVTTNFTGSFIGNGNITFGSFINDYYFEGALDEFAIYDKVLNPTEISSHYEKGIRGQDYCDEISISVSLTIFLEGPFENGALNATISSNKNFPHSQPFNNYNGAENINSVPGPSQSINVVDWVLVSLRTNIDKNSEVVKRAGFLLSNGSIVDLDGSSPLAFAVNQGSYYVVVEHRNHLPIMSKNKITLSP